jgi:hypothetical protein
MFYESYVYNEEELKNPEPIQIALNYSYPIEYMLRHEEETFNKRKKEDPEGSEEELDEEFEFED